MIDTKEMRVVFAEKLIKIASANDRVYVVDGDINSSTKTDMFKEAFPDRFIQLGIAEQNMLGWSSGMAAAGLIPFPTTFACFITTRALDMIRVGVCYANLNVKISGCYAGLSYGKGGASHISGEDIAIMRSLPNMRVLCPSDPLELEQMLDAMVAYEGPIYLRVYKSALPSVNSPDYKFDWKPRIIKDGEDVLLVSAGQMLHRCLRVAQELESRKISAAVLNLSTIKPLDTELLAKYSARCRGVVTVEDHNIYGGIGSAVCEALSDICPTRIKRVGYLDEFVESGVEEDLLKKYGLSDREIINKVEEILNH